MKIKFILAILVFISVNAVAYTADTVWVSSNNEHLQINELVKDFGLLVKNEKTVTKFKLINLEDKPLVVWHVTTSCGCTSPQWTEKPVKTNEEAIIKVKYDSSILGAFNKAVYVYTNFDDKPIKFIIKGKVVNEKSNKVVVKQSTSFNAKLPTPKE